MSTPSLTDPEQPLASPRAYRQRLAELLQDDLAFRGQPTGYASHGFHAFPAKFPPQLARHFIEGLTERRDCVLDPMMGSGTTLVEAFLLGRHAQGFDIDPLARLQSRVKTRPLDSAQAKNQGEALLARARRALATDRAGLNRRLAARFNARTQRFIAYWFASDTQVELQALAEQIEDIASQPLRAFMQLTLSAIIITKTGGVSQALDLAHTRPHRAKVIVRPNGQIVQGHEWAQSETPRIRFLTKTLKSPLDAFQRRLALNTAGLAQLPVRHPVPCVEEADAQCLPIPDATVDLIVTSPPYAANAIDYMRAHKFALVWLGYPIERLSAARGAYIGGETLTDACTEALPTRTLAVIARLAAQDAKKGRALHRYYAEMQRVLGEMQRVLRPGRAAVVVVGSSVMRGQDTEIAACLSEIGQRAGFEEPVIGVRALDRDRRLLPARQQKDAGSAIQNRMYQEYVMGFYKAPG